MSKRWLGRFCALLTIVLIGVPSLASETVTYSYDPLGRLVASVVSGGISNGAQTGTTFDPAGNRTTYTVSGAPVTTSFSINSVSSTEGTALNFTFTRTGSTAGTNSVTYATSDGTATSGSDYTAASMTLTFAPGETSKPITVPTNDDTVVESTETMLVTLSSPTGGATITTAVGTGTITDNDLPPPSFSISSASAVTEGGYLAFTLTKTGTTSASYSVNYASAAGTATAGSGLDYTAQSGTLTFAAGNTSSQTITVPTNDDSVVETAETVLMNLSGATGGATITTAQGSGTINDNDFPPPSFAISNATAITEGGNLTFTVTKTGTTSASYSVNYASANGTATAGSGLDYTAQSGTLTFAAGNTSSQTITVPTNDDSVVETAETVLMNLSGATGGATITTAQGSGTINDNDVGFAIGNATAVTEGGTMSFTVTKTGGSGSYSVDYATASGTATSGIDFTATSGTLTFLGSDTTRTVTVPTIDDTAVESAETILMNLSGATGGAPITTSQGSGTINDNDTANQPPVANADTTSFMCSSTQLVNLVANDTDPENNTPLTLVSITPPSGSGYYATVTNSTSATVGASHSGTFTYDYVVRDSLDATSSGHLTATVSGLSSSCLQF